MSDLVFMMGRFEARFPEDRQYARNHMWALPQDGGFRFGFSAYAVRLLQDVYFLDWCVDPETELAERQQIGSIESSKAESDLYAPIAGRLTEFNRDLLSDPSAINVDKYGAGWLFQIAGGGAPLLSPVAYLEHLAAAWKVAERTIKGQMNEE
ncbi:MAG TPA: glycine cleavage system protein H [Pirellulales bacterium]|jgi:glycine cleavage system H protein|nr:glycine cleavage system protein H [Pirellulales bacterium]